VGWGEATIKASVEGVFNGLSYYGFTDGQVELNTQTRANGFEQYGAPAGGLVSVQPDLGDRVSRGDTLFEVTDAFGGVKETVTADSSGVFWRARRLPQVATGEYVCSVGTDVDSY
jgi:predicted deacylase